MAAKFKIDQEVRQILETPIQGKILKRIIVEDDDCYLVEWTSEDGSQHQRVFKEEEIELV